MTGYRDTVSVTGLGLLTPAGRGIEENVEKVWSGTPTATHSPELEGLATDFSCRVPDFSPRALLGRTAVRTERVSQLALVAARDAVADAGLDPTSWDGPRVGVVLGTSLAGWAAAERGHTAFVEEGPTAVSPQMLTMGPVNMTAGFVSIDLGALGPNLMVSTACASGNTAIGYARLLLNSGACDVVITGGSEAVMTPAATASLIQAGALSTRSEDPAAASRPFDAGRDGFVPGEGAAILVLERDEDARARGARVHARIAGYGASADGYHPVTPHPEGAGAERAIRAALADAGMDAGDIAHINAHGTSTPFNDRTEAEVVRRVFPHPPAMSSTKGVIGHLLGAAGAAEAAYTVLAVERGEVPPTANLVDSDVGAGLDLVAEKPRTGRFDTALSTSLGFGGQTTAIVVVAA